MLCNGREPLVTGGWCCRSKELQLGLPSTGAVEKGVWDLDEGLRQAIGTLEKTDEQKVRAKTRMVTQTGKTQGMPGLATLGRVEGRCPSLSPLQTGRLPSQREKDVILLY